MKNKKKYFYIKVQMPWGTIANYQVSKDLSFALQQQLEQKGEYYSIIKGALINVPIIENSFQHHYHTLVIPVLVRAVFIRNENFVWHSRSQFISKNNIDFNDFKQIKYLQHDYSKFNKWIIKLCWKYWKKKIVK